MTKEGFTPSADAAATTNIILSSMSSSASVMRFNTSS